MLILFLFVKMCSNVVSNDILNVYLQNQNINNESNNESQNETQNSETQNSETINVTRIPHIYIMCVFKIQSTKHIYLKDVVKYDGTKMKYKKINRNHHIIAISILKDVGNYIARLYEIFNNTLELCNLYIITDRTFEIHISLILAHSYKYNVLYCNSLPFVVYTESIASFYNSYPQILALTKPNSFSAVYNIDDARSIITSIKSHIDTMFCIIDYIILINRIKESFPNILKDYAIIIQSFVNYNAVKRRQINKQPTYGSIYMNNEQKDLYVIMDGYQNLNRSYKIEDEYKALYTFDYYHNHMKALYIAHKDIYKNISYYTACFIDADNREYQCKYFYSDELNFDVLKLNIQDLYSIYFDIDYENVENKINSYISNDITSIS